MVHARVTLPYDGTLQFLEILDLNLNEVWFPEQMFENPYTLDIHISLNKVYVTFKYISNI